jgi:hypothetical protein
MFLLILTVSAGGSEVKHGLYTAEGKELLAGASKDLTVTSSCPGAIGKPGETISFKIVPAEPPANAAYIRICKFLNGLEIEKTDVPVKEIVVTMSSDKPAHLMVTVVSSVACILVIQMQVTLVCLAIQAVTVRYRMLASLIPGFMAATMLVVWLAM